MFLAGTCTFYVEHQIVAVDAFSSAPYLVSGKNHITKKGKQRSERRRIAITPICSTFFMGVCSCLLKKAPESITNVQYT